MNSSCSVLAQGRAGPSNPLRVGFGGALAAVCEAGRLASQQGNVPMESVGAICAGLAGTAAGEAARKMERLLLEEFPASKVTICTDLELTLEAAGDAPAIVLVAGTGSAAVGRDSDGHVVRVGGHGPLLGDEGSSYDIGRRAAIFALREHDRTGKSSELGTAILKETRVQSWTEFQSKAHAVPDEVFPRIFSVVTEAAEKGSVEAREFLQIAAAELSWLVNDLVERLNLKEKQFLLVKSGGMIGRSEYFDHQMNQRLAEAAPLAQFGELAMSPAQAAARIALRSLENREVDRARV